MRRKKFVLILGGARSGKSDYAQKTAASLSDQVVYLATAQAGDDEMELRIKKHRASRPESWRTIEAPRQVGEAVVQLAPDAEVVLVDCLTLLTANCMAALPESAAEEEIQSLIDAEVNEIRAAYEKMNATWLVVSNEVGLGLVPPYPLGRIYRDVLGRVNQHLAAAADEVIFMAAGLPLCLKSIPA